jgi:hypothetical protein
MDHDTVNSPDPYADFHRRIEQYVSRTEAYLKVPHGTIWALHSDNDFVFTIKVFGIVEPLLKETIRSYLKGAFEHPKVAISGSEAMIKSILRLPLEQLRIIASEFGVITEQQSSFIQAIAEVRNRYAHNIANVSLGIFEICDKIGDRSLQSKLVGLPTEKLRDIAPPQLKTLIWYNLTHFLGSTLHIIDPPPPPAGGILGELFAKLAKEGLELPSTSIPSE